MKYEIDFGKSPVVFPELDEETLSEAGKNDLALLVYLVACGDGDFDAEEAAEALGMEKSEAQNAFAFLHGAGVIKTGRKKSAKKAKTDKEKENGEKEPEKEEVKAGKTADKNKGGKILPAAEAPSYSGLEIEKIIAENNLRPLVEECERILGKMFSPSDVAVIVSLFDYLNLEPEYIYLLFGFCKQKLGKSSVRYIEKTAYNLYDEGVDTTEALEEYVSRAEKTAQTGARFKRLVGREGDLSKKESAGLDNYCNNFGYDFEIIKKAYDITVENTGKYSFKYMDTILQNWADAGYRSLEEIEEALKAYAGKKDSKKGKKSGSFETDDFFEKAMKRSVEMMKKNGEGDKK